MSAKTGWGYLLCDDDKPLYRSHYLYATDVEAGAMAFATWQHFYRSGHPDATLEVTEVENVFPMDSKHHGIFPN